MMYSIFQSHLPAVLPDPHALYPRTNLFANSKSLKGAREHVANVAYCFSCDLHRGHDSPPRGAWKTFDISKDGDPEIDLYNWSHPEQIPLPTFAAVNGWMVVLPAIYVRDCMMPSPPAEEAPVCQDDGGSSIPDLASSCATLSFVHSYARRLAAKRQEPEYVSSDEDSEEYVEDDIVIYKDEPNEDPFSFQETYVVLQLPGPYWDNNITLKTEDTKQLFSRLRNAAADAVKEKGLPELVRGHLQISKCGLCLNETIEQRLPAVNAVFEGADF